MTAARKGIATFILESTLSDKLQKVTIKENRIKNRQRSEFYDFIYQKNVDNPKVPEIPISRQPPCGSDNTLEFCASL